MASSDGIAGDTRSTVSRAFARFSALGIATLILSACVANSNLPSQDVTALLSPAKDGAVTNSPSLEQNLTPSDKVSPPVAVGTGAESKLSPAVQSALVPSSTKPSAAEVAVNEVAKPAITPAATPAPAPAKRPEVAKKPEVKPEAKVVAKPTAKTETKVAALKSDEAKPKIAPEKPGPAKQPAAKGGGFFGTLFKNNQAGKGDSRANGRNKLAAKQRRSKRLRNRRDGEKLPGVRGKSIFGIDSEEVEEFDEPVRLASVANFARRGTHGLLIQRKGVKVGCFPPKLVRLLKRVERKFGRTPIVTSGYRSRSYNRRIRGARNSMHIHCKAADIQVKGVSKWSLAKYLRTLPGRGGVGTYCHTASVHIDIAEKRDWNRRCRRRRARRS